MHSEPIRSTADRARDEDDIKNPYANLMREVNKIDPHRLRFSPVKTDDRLLKGEISDMLLRMVGYKQLLARKYSDLTDQLLHHFDLKKRRRLLNALEDLRVRQGLLDSYYYLQLHSDLEQWEGPPFVTLRTTHEGMIVAVITAKTEETYVERTTELFHLIDQRMEREALGVYIGSAFDEELRRKMDTLSQPYVG